MDTELEKEFRDKFFPEPPISFPPKKVEVTWTVDELLLYIDKNFIARSEVENMIEELDSRDFDDWSDTTREVILSTLKKSNQ